MLIWRVTFSYILIESFYDTVIIYRRFCMIHWIPNDELSMFIEKVVLSQRWTMEGDSMTLIWSMDEIHWDSIPGINLSL